MIKILMPLIILTILSGCMAPDEFKGIKWDVDVTIPLMNRTYPIFDFEDENHFIMDDNEIYLVYSNEMVSEESASQLKLQAKSSALIPIVPSLDPFEVEMPIDESGLFDEEDIDILYAQIKSGILKVEVLDVDSDLLSLTIDFLDIIDPLSSYLTVFIDDFSNSVHEYDISNYTINEEQNETILDAIRFRVTADFNPTVNQLGDIRFFFDEEMNFDYIRGHLLNKKVMIDDVDYDSGIQFPDNISNVLQIHDVTMSISFTNELGFDALFVGKITGYNEKDGSQGVIDIVPADGIIFARADLPDSPKETRVVIDKPGLNDFINAFPSIIKIENSYLSLGNKDGEPGFASASANSYGEYELIAPAKFTLNSGSIKPANVFSMTVDESNKEYIRDNPLNAAIKFNLENTIPMGVYVDVFFSTSPDTLQLFNPQDFPDIPSLLYTNNGISAGSSEDPTYGTVEFELNDENLKFFLNDEIYYGLKMNFDETTDIVTVKPEDYLKLIGRIELNIKVDIE